MHISYEKQDIFSPNVKKNGHHDLAHFALHQSGITHYIFGEYPIFEFSNFEIRNLSLISFIAKLGDRSVKNIIGHLVCGSIVVLNKPSDEILLGMVYKVSIHIIQSI